MRIVFTIGGWPAALHHRCERRSVGVRRPDLEDVDALRDQLVVPCEAAQDRRLLLRAGVVSHVRRRGQEQLQRRQTLLTIDDRVERDCARPVDDLVEHDRSEEVRVTRIATAVQALFQDGLDVLPKRLPLPLGVPHVRPLVEGHDVADVTLKQLLHCPRVRLHARTFVGRAAAVKRPVRRLRHLGLWPRHSRWPGADTPRTSVARRPDITGVGNAWRG